MRVALLELRRFVYEMISQERNWCTRTNLKGQQQYLREMGERRKYQTRALERQKRGKEYNDEERRELHVTSQYVNLI